MKKTTFTYALFLTLSSLGSALAADFVTGYIIDRGNGEFEIQGPKGNFEVVTSEIIKKSLPSLANPTFVKQSDGNPYSYEFKGEIKGNQFVLRQTPTNIPGAEKLTGTLRYDEGLDVYMIGNERVDFGYTKVLNGYEFDEVSKKSFVGKNIIAEGQ